MSIGTTEFLSFVGLVIGIIIALKTEKPSINPILIMLSISLAFEPALKIVTDILSISSISFFRWLALVVVSFSLGATLTYALRLLPSLFGRVLQHSATQHPLHSQNQAEHHEHHAEHSQHEHASQTHHSGNEK